MIKKLFIALLSITCLTILNSCGPDIDWEESTEAKMDFWVNTQAFIMFANKEDVSLLDYRKPDTWPVISEKRLSESEVSEIKSRFKTYTSQTEFAYCDGNAYMVYDDYNNVSLFNPRVKCSNTGKTDTYVYFAGHEDVITTKFRYSKHNSDWYAEIIEILYNDNVIWKHGFGDCVSRVVK